VDVSAPPESSARNPDNPDLEPGGLSLSGPVFSYRSVT
jgi:hypothetical protein